MIDLVKALRSRATWETATGITEPSEHIDWMAADEITSLRGQVEALDNERNRLWADKLKMQGEITRLREEESSKLKVRTSILNALREENAQMREALKPFAGMAQHCEGMSDSESQCVFVGDLRAARAAIREGGEDGGHS
jgi:hypothetical protein